MEVPASTLPARGIAPVRANIASKSVVLPLWKGPTSAMHRGPRGLLTSCPIAPSSSGARPLIGSAKWMLPLHRGFGKKEKRRCGASLGLRGRDRRREPAARGNTPLVKAAPCSPRHGEGLERSAAFAPCNDGGTDVPYLPGRSSRLSSPAATLRPTWPCRLSGCSAIELFEPPTSTLPPAPTPIVALPWAPA